MIVDLVGDPFSLRGGALHHDWDGLAAHWVSTHPTLNIFQLQVSVKCQPPLRERAIPRPRHCSCENVVLCKDILKSRLLAPLALRERIRGCALLFCTIAFPFNITRQRLLWVMVL